MQGSLAVALARRPRPLPMGILVGQAHAKAQKTLTKNN